MSANELKKKKKTKFTLMNKSPFQICPNASTRVKKKNKIHINEKKPVPDLPKC